MKGRTTIIIAHRMSTIEKNATKSSSLKTAKFSKRVALTISRRKSVSSTSYKKGKKIENFIIVYYLNLLRISRIKRKSLANLFSLCLILFFIRKQL